MESAMTCSTRSGWIRPAAFAFALVAFSTTFAVASLHADDEHDKDDHPITEEKEHADAEATADHKKTDDLSGKTAKDKKESSDRIGKSKDSHAKRDRKTGKSKDAKSADSDKSSSDDESSKDKDAPKLSVTHHTATIDGKKIAYTATAGQMVMKTDEGDPKANVFFIAYTKDSPKKFSRDPQGERDAENSKNGKPKSADKHAADPSRPITFCFNGGPGSSSVWLHLGMLGPVRVKLDSDARPLPPPHELIPNEFSLLDVTDLVFIDPVSTGFSRPVKGEDKKQFHGYDEDLRSVAQFIHDYTSKYGRWGSPKFLIGESYGGLRAAGLAGMLQDRYHYYLNGIVMVSAVVDFQTLMAWGHNDIAYTLFLPSYTATAWYHKQLSDELQDQSLEEVVAAAEKFAAGDYLHALAAGGSLDEDYREEVIERLAELTGLSEEYIDGSNLRISMPRFGKELLREERRVVGRFDSRYLGIDSDNVGESTEHDPSATAVFGTFTSALNEYLRTTLKVEDDRVYEILTSHVHPWSYEEFTNRYVDASEPLRRAMTENPYLKVFAACGYYDLATPSFAMEYTRDHLGLAPESREQFHTEFYQGGHMMYAHEPSLEKLRKDLLKFYESALDNKKPKQAD